MKLNPVDISNITCCVKLKNLIIEPRFWKYKLLEDFPNNKVSCSEHNYYKFYKAIFTGNQECVGNFLFNKGPNKGENENFLRGLMKLAAESIVFQPEYSVDFNYLIPNLVENDIIVEYQSDYRPYIMIIFNVEKPCLDVNNCINFMGSKDGQWKYSVKNQWIENQLVYYLYELNQLTDYNSGINLHIQPNNQLNHLFNVNDISLISMEVWFRNQNSKSNLNKDYNKSIKYRIANSGNHFLLEMGDDFISCVFFDKEPEKIIVNLNGVKSFYDKNIVRFIQNVFGYEKFCLPFFLPQFGSNCVVGYKIDVFQIEFFSKDCVELICEVETINANPHNRYYPPIYSPPKFVV